ncbi:MAG1210 family protein [Mycoplasma crocodyli]|uniref:Uncharacterized protein n=1 Tax=Mycoplasma crocodyli (strain ATCC 51981 / MP145) TaxID=512564 RepID=D5E4M4_MYCCM|nr:hypothetical protein [Mycoplasma crocodyli]ADE19468.1 conserved hypothetical protein [Mycoplasma crocodyli MP145]
MKNIEKIYDVNKTFKDKYQQEHEENTINYFCDLVEKSKIDISENIKTNVEIRKLEKSLVSKTKSTKTNKKMKKVLIVLGVILFLLGWYFLIGPFVLSGAKDYTTTKKIILSLSGGLMLIISILMILYVFKINKKILANNLMNSKSDAKLEELKELVKKQLEPLNGLYSYGTLNQIVSKTIPDFEFNDFLNAEWLHNFLNTYNFEIIDFGKNGSYKSLISGELYGNKFLLADMIKLEIETKKYFGNLEVAYSEKSKKINGDTVIKTVKQNLEASVVKSYPNFYQSPFLLYGNQLLPNLDFSRDPSELNSKKPDEVDKFIQKKAKEFEKLDRNSTKQGGQFSLMSNLDFEVLFNCTDRNNEKDFRMLFTPSTQKELTDIFRDRDTSFGDVYTWVKNSNMNILMSSCLEDLKFEDYIDETTVECNSKLYYSPDEFYNTNINIARQKFIDANVFYFKKLYYIFAPILATHEFHNSKPKETTKKYNGEANFATIQHEEFANELLKNEIDAVSHNESLIDDIMKTKLVTKHGLVDEVEATAYGFNAVEKVDYIDVKAGNGKYYPVPVTWYDYVPVKKTSRFYAISIPVKESLLSTWSCVDISNHELWNDNFGSDVFPTIKNSTLILLKQDREYDLKLLEQIVMDYAKELNKKEKSING